MYIKNIILIVIAFSFVATKPPERNNDYIHQKFYKMNKTGHLDYKKLSSYANDYVYLFRKSEDYLKRNHVQNAVLYNYGEKVKTIDFTKNQYDYLIDILIEDIPGSVNKIKVNDNYYQPKEKDELKNYLNNNDAYNVFAYKEEKNYNINLKFNMLINIIIHPEFNKHVTKIKFSDGYEVNTNNNYLQYHKKQKYVDFAKEGVEFYGENSLRKGHGIRNDKGETFSYYERLDKHNVSGTIELGAIASNITIINSLKSAIYNYYKNRYKSGHWNSLSDKKYKKVSCFLYINEDGKKTNTFILD